MGILSSIKKIFSAEETKSESDSQPLVGAESSPTFYLDTIEAHRAEKDRFFRSSPYSPLTDRINFAGLSYYPPNRDYRYTLPLQRLAEPEPLTFQTSNGEERIYYRIGTVSFEVGGQSAQLTIYNSDDHDELFLPFRDASSGTETYGAGRYLEPESLTNDQILLDFNLAYSPFCAYSEEYSCPLTPFENHLKVAILAGEKLFENTISS